MRGVVAYLRQDAESAPSSAGRPFTVRAIAVVLFRAAQLAGRRSSPIAGVLKQLLHAMTGADIAWQAQVGPGLVLYHPTGVVIGPHCRIGARCKVQSDVTLGGRGQSQGAEFDSPVIGDDCELGSGCRVLGSVTVGNRVLIGANAVVIQDIPDDCIAVGVPARFQHR